MPPLRPGEEAGEFVEVAGANQFAHSGVIRWRQRPVAAGRGAAPDPPPRVLAPERFKLGVLVVPAAVGVHARRRLMLPAVARNLNLAWPMITGGVLAVLALALRSGPGSGWGRSAAADPSSPA
jgi:hypothetical protein